MRGRRRLEEPKRGIVTARLHRPRWELFKAYVEDISPLVKAKAVASALPPERVLP